MKSFLVILAVLPLAAQVPSAKNWKAPRTPDGKPDLQGVWTSATLTPLERPAELGNKQFFTKEEASQWTRQFLQSNDRDRRDGPAQVDVGRAYNEFWFSRGDAVVPTLRTSLIIDPPDGKIPALTPDGQQRAAARAEAQRLHPADGPEDRSLAERCIVWPVAGPPMVTGWLQQQLPGRAGSRIRDDPRRDDSRRAHDPYRWPAASSGSRPSVDGRPSRPLGRRHSGRRYHQFHR